jgi:hypothetical protein
MVTHLHSLRACLCSSHQSAATGSRTHTHAPGALLPVAQPHKQQGMCANVRALLLRALLQSLRKLASQAPDNAIITTPTQHPTAEHSNPASTHLHSLRACQCSSGHNTDTRSHTNSTVCPRPAAVAGQVGQSKHPTMQSSPHQHRI